MGEGLHTVCEQSCCGEIVSESALFLVQPIYLHLCNTLVLLQQLL
jgi:hypothetical protein